MTTKTFPSWMADVGITERIHIKTNMSEEMIEDAFRERNEWLAEMNSKEEWVLRDRENNMEFIFSASEDEDGEEHLTKIMLPYTIQKFTILGHN